MCSNMRHGAESCENERHSCVDWVRTMAAGRGARLAATLQEVGLKLSVSGSCEYN